MNCRFFIHTLLLLASALPATAQNRADSFLIGPPKTDPAFTRPLFQRPSTVSLLAGTQGIGLSYKVAVAPRWNLRAGGALIPFSYARDFDLEDFKGRATLKFAPLNVHVLAEFRPFLRSSFRFVGGLAVFIRNEITANVQPKSDFTYNGVVLTPAQQGELNFSVRWSGVAPYMGIGLFRSLPGRRFNTTVDLGTYYLGRPMGHISGTGILAGNDANDKQFNENISAYRWLPVIQLNFNYKIIR